MTNVEEKVLRKEGDEYVKKVTNSIYTVFLISGLGFIVTSAIIMFEYAEAFTLTIFLCCGISLVFSMLCSIIVPPSSYTVILRNSTLIYNDNKKTVTLPLPCSIKRTTHVITLRSNNTEINLLYDEREDADLLEFLKDVIN